MYQKTFHRFSISDEGPNDGRVIQPLRQALKNMSCAATHFSEPYYERDDKGKRHYMIDCIGCVCTK